MNRYKLFKAGINFNDGVERLNNDKEMYGQLLHRFLEDTHYEQFCRAMEKGDVKEAFRCAHALKGITGNLSMVKLHEDLVPLVEELRAGRIEGTEDMQEKVAKSYKDVIEVLENV